MSGIVWVGVGLLALGLSWARGRAGSGCRIAGSLGPARVGPRTSLDLDEAVERIGRALAGGLGLEQRARSHREQRVELAGQLGGRQVELHIDALGFAVRTPISPRLPDGIALRRRPRSSPSSSRPAIEVELGHVRGRVPAGLVPALVACCEPRVSTLHLDHGGLELGCEVDVGEFAGRPEWVVALVKQALRSAEQLDRDFAGS